MISTLDFSNVKIDYLFMGGLLALIQRNNKITKVILQGATISDEDLERLKSVKLKAAKIVDVTLPSGEILQIKDLEPGKNSRSKSQRKPNFK